MVFSVFFKLAGASYTRGVTWGGASVRERRARKITKMSVRERIRTSVRERRARKTTTVRERIRTSSVREIAVN